MKASTTRLAAFLGFTIAATAALSAADPAGHWEGEISLPNTTLAVRVDLKKSGADWTGTIDIPVQGLRGFGLGEPNVGEGRISFTMPNIPGDPTFAGKLSEDGESIAGDFSQAGQTFPFKLSRAEKTPDKWATPENGIPGKGFASAWQGSLEGQLFELRLVLQLEGENASLTGTIDSIDQGAKDMPITKATADGRNLHLELDGIGASYDGTLNGDGSEIAGDWQQGGRKMPLVFKRLEKAPDLTRPQDPKKPYPYHEEEVTIENAEADIKLAGTFTHPKSDGPHPAVVLLTGSGPQDRDEALVGHRPFLVLSDHLTRRGIAVLRFDDRGFGRSEGDFSEATNEDFVSDALAAVGYLKSRKEVNRAKIGLIGHSEGGITAPRAAVRSSDVAFIVLLAGVGVPMEELLVRQSEDMLRIMGGTDEMIEKQTETQRELFAIVKEHGSTPDSEEKIRAKMSEALAEFTPEQLEAMGWQESQLDGQVQMLLSPWFGDILIYDPRPTLARVKCPVLAVNGAKDVQVAATENLATIEQALKEGGNEDVTVVNLPGLNHLFQTCETGAVAEYATIDETFNPQALATIAHWVREKAGLD